MSRTNLSTVSFAIGFPMGSATEPIGGITEALTTHLLRNTANRNERELARYLDSQGIVTFGNTGKTGFHLGLNCPPSNLEAALNLFEDLIFNPDFSEDILEKIIQKQMGELQQLQNIPQIRMFQSTRWEAAYGKSRVANKTMGNVEDLQKISVEDLENYYGNLNSYQPKFAAIGVDINVDDFSDFVSRLDEFGPSKPDVDLRNRPVQILNSQIDKLSAPSKNAYLGINMFSQGNKDSSLEDSIFKNVLQGGFASRMKMEIRDKRNLSYSVFAINSKFEDFGLMTFGMDVRPDRSLEALRVTFDVINNTLNEEISEDEMRRALKASQRTSLFVSDSSQSYTQWLIQRLLAEREWDLDNVNNQLKQASESDWQEVMSQFWTKKNLTLGIAGEPGEAADHWKLVVEEKMN